MERLILKIDDVNVAKACVAFAEQLGLTVSPDTMSRITEGAYLSTGSKKYDINWIKNDAFAEKAALEADVDITDLLSGGYGYFIDSCLEAALTEDTEDTEDEISLVETNVPSNSVITALYNKVKAQRKAPSKYFLVFKNDAWVASTVSEGSYANLADAFTALN